MGKKKTAAKWVIISLVGLNVLSVSPRSIEATPSQPSYSDKIEELNAREDNAEEELETVVSHIKETEEEAADLVKQMQNTMDELELIQEEVDQLTKLIDQRESKLESQVRSVQITGHTRNVLSFILEAETLTDILGRLDVVTTLFSANQDLMSKQMEDMEKVKENEQKTLDKKEEQALIAAKLENKKAELLESQSEQEELIATIAAEKSAVEEERLANSVQNRQQTIQTTRTSANTGSSESNELKTSSSQSVSPSPASGSILGAAHSVKGARYLYGGSTTSGFDCSGYTQFAFRQAGKSIPRTAAAQFGASQRLARADAKPGDLIFFNQSGRIDHVGIYLGGGKFIGAQTSTGVAVASFTSGYWSRYVAGFGRP